MPRQGWPSLRTKHARRLVAIIVSTLAALVAVEVGARLLLRPSDRSYGRLFARELPPFRVVVTTAPPAPTGMSEWHDGLIVEGRRISRGDLWGFHRPDPVLGYTHLENTSSSNGWWQSNNLGARAEADMEKAIPAGLTRILVFGDSFGHGSRVPQDAAWPAVMEHEHAGVEVVNLAVDGYGMAQSFLRFEQMRRLLDYDLAVLMFAPEADLWRDINTIRDLGEPDGATCGAFAWSRGRRRPCGHSPQRSPSGCRLTSA